MTQYVKSTSFASKDALSVGNPLKIVKGTEIDTEFNNIAIAAATKADLLSPVFTGTPIAATAAPGTSNTQLATTAFVQAALQATLQAIYPVGSIYTSTVATNPATTFGFGTWAAFGAGKVLVGQDTGDAAFDVLEETGGSKDAVVVSHTHTLTDPGHRHNTTLDGITSTNPSFQSQAGLTTYSTTTGGYEGYYSRGVADTTQADGSSSSTSTTGITIGTAGSSATNANLQPYVVVKMWKRTA